MGYPTQSKLAWDGTGLQEALRALARSNQADLCQKPEVAVSQATGRTGMELDRQSRRHQQQALDRRERL